MSRLDTCCDLSAIRESRMRTKAESIAGATDKDGVLCPRTGTIDAGVLAVQPRLKAVSNYTAGFTNVDVQAATAQGIPVTARQVYSPRRRQTSRERCSWQ